MASVPSTTWISLRTSCPTAWCWVPLLEVFRRSWPGTRVQVRALPMKMAVIRVTQYVVVLRSKLPLGIAFSLMTEAWLQAHDAFWGSFKSSKCVDDMGANASSLCVVPYHLYDHLETPVFIVEAITDAVIMCGFEGLPCKPVDLLRPEVCRYSSHLYAQAGWNFFLLCFV